MTHPIATVGALIVNRRGECLLLRTHKWRDRFGVPGGKIQAGETMLGALKREVFEETGLTLQEAHLLMVQDCVDSAEFYRPAHFLLSNYLAFTEDEAVVLNDEAQACLWVKPEQALMLELNSFTRLLVEAALRVLASCAPLGTGTLLEAEVQVVGFSPCKEDQ